MPTSLRCHNLDRSDSLSMIAQSIGWIEKDIEKLKEVLKTTSEALQKKQEDLEQSKKWHEFVKSTLHIHWINDPEKYVKENFKS